MSGFSLQWQDHSITPAHRHASTIPKRLGQSCAVRLLLPGTARGLKWPLNQQPLHSPSLNNCLLFPIPLTHSHSKPSSSRPSPLPRSPPAPPSSPPSLSLPIKAWLAELCILTAFPSDGKQGHHFPRPEAASAAFHPKVTFAVTKDSNLASTWWAVWKACALA